MEATRRGVLMAVTRGWLGYGRRWKGGHQAPPDPQPVIVCGIEESDDGFLNLAWRSHTPIIGTRAQVTLWNLGASDVFVEAIRATSAGPSLSAAIVLTDETNAAKPPATLPPAVLRTQSAIAIDSSQTVAALTTEVRIPVGELVRVRLLVPQLFALTVACEDAGAAAVFAVLFAFREQA